MLNAIPQNTGSRTTTDYPYRTIWTVDLAALCKICAVHVGCVLSSALSFWLFHRPSHRSRSNNASAGTSPQMRNSPENLTPSTNEVPSHVVKSRSTAADA
jgi:hypothetical protein